MQGGRLYFIDQLRFLAIIALIFYHTALIFASLSNFPIKNNELSRIAEDSCFFLHGWRLTLLFFISGVGTSFMIRNGTTFLFAKGRLKRLFIPLIFGVLIIIPPQIYFERLSQGFEYDSYLEFYLQSFTKGFYPYGDISWNHLWFVAYLLIYSLISIPIFKKITKAPFENSKSNWRIILWGIPMAIIVALLKPFSLGVQNIVNDIAMFSFYWLVFLSGFIVGHGKYWEYLKAKRIYILSAAILITLIVFYLRNNFSFEKGEITTYGYDLLRTFSAWLWVLAFLGIGKKHLNYQGKYLSTLNESVYPVYILHQTVIICLGYFVVKLNLSAGLKFSIITIGTIGICFGLFFLIKLTNFTRFLFGMSPKSCSIR